MARPKQPSRARKRERLLAACAAVHPAGVFDLAIAGAGAAGLAAAVAAGRAGLRTVVIERSLEPGLPILATGNGRCNLANVCLSPAAYNAPGFVRAVFASDNAAPRVVAFFQSLGLQTVEEQGRLYPVSRSAQSVRQVLLDNLDPATVLACGRALASAHREDGVWSLQVHPAYQDAPQTIRARDLLVATGGASAAARMFGLPCAPESPVLCALACETGPFCALAGKRYHAAVSLERSGARVWSENGEVLVRENGLSGIVVFNASRHALRGDTLRLDLLAGCDPALLDRQLAGKPAGPGALAGVLDPDTARLVFETTPSARDAAALAKRARAVRFTVTGPLDAAHAQVTRGGVALDAVDPATLRAAPGLQVAGEALDVDGPCGGYNLGFAWASGLAAVDALSLGR